jgi:hypothetical protein
LEVNQNVFWLPYCHAFSHGLPNFIWSTRLIKSTSTTHSIRKTNLFEIKSLSLHTTEWGTVKLCLSPAKHESPDHIIPQQVQEYHYQLLWRTHKYMFGLQYVRKFHVVFSMWKRYVLWSAKHGSNSVGMLHQNLKNMPLMKYVYYWLTIVNFK